MIIPWNHTNAAHLLRKAGFGGRPHEVEHAVARGLAGTVEDLLVSDPQSDDLPKHVRTRRELQAWWLRRMATTKAPFRERLTLFFHNHFATGHRKGKPDMHRQNSTFRNTGLGRYRDLLLAMARDPSMLRWLDNRSNTKKNPNENWARELMELFSTGVFDRWGQPNYNEKDVTSAARAFTGWTLEKGEFKFKSSKHDYGKKQFRGLKADLNGDDVIDNLAYDPATARRIPQLLFSWFAFPVDLDHPIVDELSTVYLANDTALEPVLHYMFTHPTFYEPRAFRAVVKSPAEFLVGALRLLDVKLKKTEALEKLGRVAQDMGQNLFEPSTVFGWPGGATWIEASGMHQRALAAAWIADTRKKKDPFKFKIEQLFGPTGKWSEMGAEETVQQVLTRLDLADARPTTVAALVDYLNKNDKGKHQEFVLDKKSIESKGRGLLALVLSCPEYQLA